ncbi:MAG TPA: S41 family peptidase [Thermomicrobiales bacterium]
MVYTRLVGLLLAIALLTACGGGAAPAPTATGAPSTAAAVAATATPAPTTVAAASAPATAVATRTTAPVAGAPSPAPVPTGATTATRAATPIAGGTTTRVAATASPQSARDTGNLPNTTPAAGAALIEQAIGYLLDHYVDVLPSNTLFGAAYNGAIATLTASGKAPQAQTPTLTGNRQQDAAAFKAAYLALATAAGAEINQNLLAYESIRAVATAVDECHTAFLDPEQYRSVNAGLSGNNTYGGIGVTIRTQTRPVTIGGIFPNTPAAKGGLRTGDAILKVGDTDVTDLPADAISPLVRGAAGSQVTLTLGRVGEAAPLVITLTRADIQVPVFTTDVLPGPDGTKVGYMKLYSFSTGAEAQVQAALEAFEQEGVTGWILDLRDNGGGYIDTLSQIASRFLDGRQPVAYEIERGGAEQPIPTNPARYFSPQHPFAILINGGSASASEALASAAADYGFARLFGQKTSGCLAGATSYRLADGSAMQVTIWKIVSPQHREINRVGQRPDQEIQPDPTGVTDPVLDAAVAWLATQPQR